MGDRFYRDDSEDPRAEFEHPYELLGHFLESDIQGSISICEEILGKISEIFAGKTKEWQQTGNAHTIVLSQGGACVEAEFGNGQESCRLTLEHFKKAVSDWKSFLGKGSC
ncbi:MAG: YacL family protein [Planctomycetota bacterium]